MMKLYDLAPDAEMTPIIGLLHSTVKYNFLRLKRLLHGGMSQEEIDYKGMNNELNSIAQLLRHLTVVDLHWVYRLQSKTVPLNYQEKFGPMYDQDCKIPMIKDVSLETLFEQYEEIQAMFRDVCLSKTDDDLLRDVPFENGNTATIRWGIWHIADHSRHHYANIVRLKKMVRS
jgi:uncharacterized damage-inducible protein DinB